MNHLHLHIQTLQHTFRTSQGQEEEMLTKREDTLQATPSKTGLLNREHTKKEAMSLCGHAVLHTGL